VTGVGREEVYRNRQISAQAMTLKGGVHHKVRVNVTDEKGFWLGPFIDYEASTSPRTMHAKRGFGSVWRS
jgi:hypothetical protein